MNNGVVFTVITVALVLFGAIQWARVDWLRAEVRVFLDSWSDRSDRHYTDRELVAAIRRLRKAIGEGWLG